MLLSNPNPWSVDYPECLDRDTVVKLTHFQSCGSNKRLINHICEAAEVVTSKISEVEQIKPKPSAEPQYKHYSFMGKSVVIWWSDSHSDLIFG